MQKLLNNSSKKEEDSEPNDKKEIDLDPKKPKKPSQFAQRECNYFLLNQFEALQGSLYMENQFMLNNADIVISNANINVHKQKKEQKVRSISYGCTNQFI